MHSTHRGFGLLPGSFPAPDPVFPLRRKPPVRSRPDDGPRPVEAANDPRTELPPSWPFPTELDPVFWDDELDERWLPKRTARSVAVRIVGSLTLIAALVGCGTVLSRPQARREAIDWLTFGHPAAVLDAAHRVASALSALGLEG
jgi:hypothetical protein